MEQDSGRSVIKKVIGVVLLQAHKRLCTEVKSGSCVVCKKQLNFKQEKSHHGVKPNTFDISSGDRNEMNTFDVTCNNYNHKSTKNPDTHITNKTFSKAILFDLPGTDDLTIHQKMNFNPNNKDKDTYAMYDDCNIFQMCKKMHRTDQASDNGMFDGEACDRQKIKKSMHPIGNGDNCAIMEESISSTDIVDRGQKIECLGSQNGINKTVEDISKHVRKHPSDESFKCSKSDRAFNQSLHLQDHTMQAGDNQLNRVHIKKQAEDESYKCDKCNKRFSRFCHLKAHIEEKRYKCEKCDREFYWLYGLKRHMRIHSKVKPYKCDRCERRFNQVSHLKEHMRIHTGENNYKCGQCDKWFNRFSNLKLHMRIHTGDKPYKCEQCDKRFIRFSNLKRHMIMHTADKPYKCEQCDRGFYWLCDLKAHMRIHTGDKPYKCDKCDKRFSLFSNLKGHMRIHLR